jgi:hypothetical protein
MGVRQIWKQFQQREGGETKEDHRKEMGDRRRPKRRGIGKMKNEADRNE